MKTILITLACLIGITFSEFVDPFVGHGRRPRISNYDNRRWTQFSPYASPTLQPSSFKVLQLQKGGAKLPSQKAETNGAIYPNYAKFIEPKVGTNIMKEPRPITSSKPVAGTPLHFKEIVIGRCWQYQMKIGLKVKEQINCEKVWDYFQQAFAFKGPCEAKTKDYAEFLEKIEEDVPKNKALLWSGCRELAHKLSDFDYSKRFTTLEDTLAGYLFQGLSWCGKKDAPGINFDSCPYDCSIQAPYWAMANLKFAKKLQGVVHVLLNGTRQHLEDKRIYPSYLKDRYYFGPYVIPNIDPSKVTEVKIIVAHTLKLKPLEKCGEKSIKLLQKELGVKGIRVTCEDDPDLVRHLLCVDWKFLEECKIYHRGDSSV